MQQRQFDAIGDLVEFMRQCMFCMHRYEERIDRVETRITARLRDQLDTARNANETFRDFVSSHSALLCLFGHTYAAQYANTRHS